MRDLLWSREEAHQDRMPTGTNKRVALAALPVLWIVWSCASPEAPLGESVGSTPPPLGVGDASVEGGDATVDTLMCVATECPSPYLTCPSERGTAYLCGTDPRRDSQHCGGCGNVCPQFPPLNMRSRCADGRCVLECLSMPRPVGAHDVPTDYRNCNGYDEDGCEVDVLIDEANCGACGNACQEGVPCIVGQCGCPKGLTPCGDECVDLEETDEHCSACFNVCPQPEAPCADPPLHTGYGCRGGACEQLKCDGGWADCDNDLSRGCASNGCEVWLNDDPKNCGACGVVCQPGETCRPTGSGSRCFASCEGTGLRDCASGCEDILNDPDNCGGCAQWCPFKGPQTERTCEKGFCGSRCAEGFGDCNGDPLDGCETNLRIHPEHCGACMKACDVAAGQPCVDGKCLERPCAPSEAK